MVRVIRCHRRNMKNNIINDSEVRGDSVITIADGAIVPLAVSVLDDLKTKTLIRAVSTLRELK